MTCAPTSFLNISIFSTKSSTSDKNTFAGRINMLPLSLLVQSLLKLIRVQHFQHKAPLQYVNLKGLIHSVLHSLQEALFSIPDLHFLLALHHCCNGFCPTYEGSDPSSNKLSHNALSAILHKSGSDWFERPCRPKLLRCVLTTYLFTSFVRTKFSSSGMVVKLPKTACNAASSHRDEGI